MPSTTNGASDMQTIEAVDTEKTVDKEPISWREYGNSFVLMNCQLPPETATAEGYVLELKKGQKVFIDIDFLAAKYGRDIQSMGFANDKEGWLELQDNLFELHANKAKQEIDNQLMATAKQLYKINPSKAVEVYYKELKALAA